LPGCVRIDLLEESDCFAVALALVELSEGSDAKGIGRGDSSVDCQSNDSVGHVLMLIGEVKNNMGCRLELKRLVQSPLFYLALRCGSHWGTLWVSSLASSQRQAGRRGMPSAITFKKSGSGPTSDS